MACHYPKPAYLSSEGKVTFVRREKALGHTAFVHIPCGMCNGCKAGHARDWAIRCYHESQMHEDSCFVTLTYRDEMLPPHGSLNAKDLQKFFKSLREKIIPQIRFFACGEYGTKKGRPHYHAVIFGWRPGDKRLVNTSAKGNPQYESQVLEKAWPYGFAPWSDFDPSCARYVAHYTADKLKSYAKDSIDPETGLKPYEVMDRDGQIWKLQSEFQRQSLKPGIGFRWFEQNYNEVFPADSVVMGGKEYPPPRAYYKWLKDIDPDLHKKVRHNRQVKSMTQEYETGLRAHQKTLSREAKLTRYKRPTHEKEIS